jgi:hypothetical protein
LNKKWIGWLWGWGIPLWGFKLGMWFILWEFFIYLLKI